MNRNGDEVFPLSALQLGIWWDCAIDPTSTTSLTPAVFRIRSPLDVDALRRAWQLVVDRHPMFRTTVSVQDGLPMHHVSSHRAAPLEVVDAAGWSDDALREAAIAECQRLFDLSTESQPALVLFRKRGDDATLVFRCHHLLQDLGAMDIVFDELFRGYAAAVSGTAASLPAVEHAYYEFVRQEAETPPADRERLEQFWTAKLAGAPATLALPCDRSRPARAKRKGDSLTFPLLSPKEFEALEGFRRSEKTSLFRATLAAFDAFLLRYSGEDDVLVRTPTDCRPAGFEAVAGNFVNAVLLRERLSRETSYRQLVQQVTQTVQEAVAHKRYPFSQILKKLGGAGAPLGYVDFALMRTARCPQLSRFQMADAGTWRAEVGGLAIENAFPLSQQDGQIDFGLWTWPVDGGLVGEFKYDAHLFDRETVLRMVEHLRGLFGALLTNPDAPIGTLPMMTPSERETVLVDWNATARDVPVELAQAAFERRARSDGDAIAVATETSSITYAALDTRANQLARRLRDVGVGPEKIVGICLERSVEAVVTILAVLKAGGAFVPLDPAYPVDRLGFMVSDSQPVAVVTTRPIADRVFAAASQERPPLILLDVEADDIAQREGSALECPASPTTLAYVIYTSGSTGRPKGVLIEHRGVRNLAEDLAGCWELARGSVLLAFASMSFDATIADIFPTLLSGATLQWVSTDASLGGPPLERLMRTARVTHATLPPSVWAQLSHEALPDLSVAVSAGEACSAELVDQWASSRRTFFNNYGPTEITVCASVQRCSPGGPAPSIGRPITNTRIHILDKHMAPVPVGVVGELHLAGIGIARGYLNRPELTQERFVDNPFGEGRLYKTGDLGRYRPNGEIELIGRADTQVKLRGFRIELGEVESAVRRCPGVQDAIALIREDRGRRFLVAYYTSEGARETADLRSFLADSLPSYMIPSHFVGLPTFPLTPNGKVDRAALPLPNATPHPSRAHERVLPRTETETRLCALWKQTLGVNDIGIDDDFFELGGDSLLAIQLVRAITLALEREVPPSALLEAPTVARFSEWLGRARHEDDVLVPLRSGKGPSVVLVHGAGGHLFGYRPLIAALAPPWNVFGIRSRALAEATREHTSLQEMAQAYADAILQAHVRDARPVVLVGWSLGGVLTVEIARLLEEAGTPARLAVLLDSYRPTGPNVPLNAEETPLETVHRNLLHAHRASPTRTGIISLRARDNTHREHMDGSWREYALGPFEEEEVSGDHHSLLRSPHVEHLAERLAERLQGVFKHSVDG